MSAPVLLVTRVQFDVSVSAPLVFEQPTAELAAEGHLVTVCLQQGTSALAATHQP